MVVEPLWGPQKRGLCLPEAWVKPSSHLGAAVLPSLSGIGQTRGAFPAGCVASGLCAGRAGPLVEVREAAVWRSHGFVCFVSLAPRTGAGSVVHLVPVGCCSAVPRCVMSAWAGGCAPRGALSTLMAAHRAGPEHRLRNKNNKRLAKRKF